MKGHEAAFLWARAKMLDDKVLAGLAKGEPYHPSNNFVDLTEEPLQAQAVFLRGEGDPSLVLRLRCSREIEKPKELCDPVAAKFFGGRKFTAMPAILIDGFIEVAYTCKDIPWTSTPSSP